MVDQFRKLPKSDHLAGNMEMSVNFTAVGEPSGNWPEVWKVSGIKSC